MVISDRKKYDFNKYGSNNKKENNSEKKVDIILDLGMLNQMCSYILTENRHLIKTTQLVNMRALFDCINMDKYVTDLEKLKRINFIKRGLVARIDKRLNNKELILASINDGLLDENITGIDLNALVNLNADEIKFINENVDSILKYTFIYNNVENLYNLLTKFKAGDFVSKWEVVQDIQNSVTIMQNKFRRVDAALSTETEFRLNPEYMEDNFRDVYDKVTNPSARLVTGMQGFNEMLGGGFQCGRTYILLGQTGGGKSLTLIDLCIQLKKYNSNFVCKDPTKKPCIVYLTMENTVEETVERIYEMSTGTEMGNLPFEEALNKLRTEGELYVSDESPIDIIIKYKPNKSVDTSYLYVLSENLEDEGYEVIAFVQDHIGRIRSIDRTTDLRLELGNVANEFKVFAQLKDIPFITNFHLNRESITRTEEAFNTGKNDLIKFVGKSNVAESQVMINNIDASYMIMQEYDCSGRLWLGIMRTKKRFKATSPDVLFFPYIRNTPKLEEDYGKPTRVCVTTLSNIDSNGKQFGPSEGAVNIAPGITNKTVKPEPEEDEETYTSIDNLADGDDECVRFDKVFGVNKYKAKSKTKVCSDKKAKYVVSNKGFQSPFDEVVVQSPLDKIKADMKRIEEKAMKEEIKFMTREIVNKRIMTRVQLAS